MDWTQALKCPHCHIDGLAIYPAPDGELLPERGEAICNHCAYRLPIRNHVLDMTQRGDSRLLTMAGLCNFLPFLPWGYENVWRPRSLTLLSGEEFSVAREIALMNDWLNAQPNELLVDLGSSTDLYARGIGKQQSSAAIVAIDMAAGMLKAGGEHARREGVTNIAHVRAPVQRLPFADDSVDGLVCGGSLNEFRSMAEALREALRVCKPGGRLFAMSLLKATLFGGRIGQWNASLGGISFPTLDQFNGTIAATGWQVERQQVFGSVAFTGMKPIERTQLE